VQEAGWEEGGTAPAYRPDWLGNSLVRGWYPSRSTVPDSSETRAHGAKLLELFTVRARRRVSEQGIGVRC